MCLKLYFLSTLCFSIFFPWGALVFPQGHCVNCPALLGFSFFLVRGISPHAVSAK